MSVKMHFFIHFFYNQQWLTLFHLSKDIFVNDAVVLLFLCCTRILALFNANI